MGLQCVSTNPHSTRVRETTNKYTPTGCEMHINGMASTARTKCVTHPGQRRRAVDQSGRLYRRAQRLEASSVFHSDSAVSSILEAAETMWPGGTAHSLPLIVLASAFRRHSSRFQRWAAGNTNVRHLGVALPPAYPYRARRRRLLQLCLPGLHPRCAPPFGQCRLHPRRQAVVLAGAGPAKSCHQGGLVFDRHLTNTSRGSQ